MKTGEGCVDRLIDKAIGKKEVKHPIQKLENLLERVVLVSTAED